MSIVFEKYKKIKKKWLDAYLSTWGIGNILWNFIHHI